MNFTNEQLTKAKQAKSAEELLTYANEIGYKLTEEEAAKYFAEWHKEGEIADEELDNVSGGCGSSGPKYHKGDQFSNTATNNTYQINSEGYWNDSAGTYQYDILGTATGKQGSYTFSITKLESELDGLPRIYPQSQS